MWAANLVHCCLELKCTVPSFTSILKQLLHFFSLSASPCVIQVKQISNSSKICLFERCQFHIEPFVAYFKTASKCCWKTPPSFPLVALLPPSSVMTSTSGPSKKGRCVEKADKYNYVFCKIWKVLPCDIFSVVKQSWQCMTGKDECALSVTLLVGVRYAKDSDRRCCLIVQNAYAPNKENRSAFNFTPCTMRRSWN